jgi:predicted phage terminase large subunit-like protein
MIDPKEIDRSIDAHRQLQDLERADSEESLYDFMKNAWRYMDPSPWRDGWHIEAICEHLQAVVDGEITRLLINLPPRHSKSLTTAVAFPAWAWAQKKISHTSGPGVSFLYASYKDNLSLRDSVKCRRLIESPWYQKLWGDRFKLMSDQNTKHRFTNDKGGERLITSIGAGITGEGGNCFVAGTRVSVPGGQRRIEDLRCGDAVIAYDFTHFEAVVSKVIATSSRKTNAICTINEYIQENRLVCTVDHQIFTIERRFARADELVSGYGVLLNLENGMMGMGGIASVVRNSESEVDVYDIQVEKYQNFFAERILVHNCIVIDDPNAANEVVSEANIETTLDWWRTVMPTRINDAILSAFVIIQQRLAENDLTGHIQENESEGWTQLILPGRYEPERSYITTIGWKDPRTVPGELLWPEKFNEASLVRLEKTMGPYIFAGQIQQRPEPKGGGIIKREWWRLWEPTTYPPMEFVLAVLDTAYTEETMNDPSGMMIWGIFSGDPKSQSTLLIDPETGRPAYIDRSYVSEEPPKAFMMYAWDEHLELHDLVTKTAKMCKFFKVDLLVIENKASGISVAQEIRRLHSNERYSVQLFDPKSQDKTARLYSVQHLFAEGLIFAPNKVWSERAIVQVGSFGGKPGPKHDEYVDLTSMGLRKLREMGLLAREVEHRAEREALTVYPKSQAMEPLYPT